MPYNPKFLKALQSGNLALELAAMNIAAALRGPDEEGPTSDAFIRAQDLKKSLTCPIRAWLCYGSPRLYPGIVFHETDAWRRVNHQAIPLSHYGDHIRYALGGITLIEAAYPDPPTGEEAAQT